MKIAVPSKDDKGLESEVEEHFGRARYYTIVEVDRGRVVNVEILENPFLRHEPGDIPRLLKEHGVEAVLAGNIGARARRYFKDCGIEVIAGCSGKVENAVKTYFRI